jgi:tetratricopeptide (TPR) repeat protein
MGLIDPASLARRCCGLVLACLLTGCAHISRVTEYHDALGPGEHLRLGASYEAQGLRAEASGQYQMAVKGDPGLAEGWLALGNMEFTDGRLKEAGADFRKALKASPHHAGASNNLAMVALAGNGSLTEAEALARDALLTAGALRPYVLDTLANIYLRERRYPEADAAVVQAEAVTPPENSAVLAQLRETRKSMNAARTLQENN